MLTDLAMKLINKLRPQRSDALGRERGQAVVRLVLSLVAEAYLVFSHIPLDFSHGIPDWLLLSLGFVLFSVMIVIASQRADESVWWRRLIANIADVGIVTIGLATLGEVGIPLFVLYLWATLGNGIRFGLSSLAVSAVLSLIGFAVVVATTELWQSHVMMSVGVAAALILLPAYVAHLVRQLHLTRQQAEEASAAKSRFLARMSHEMRTPLSGILGSTHLLRTGRRWSMDEGALLDVVQRSAELSLQQIENILDFSKIEAGKLQIEKAVFDLHELVNTTASMIRPAAQEKQLRLLVRMAPAVPFRVIGDAHHLREVLLNLLSNAVKFTGHGYVSLDVRYAPGGDSARLRFEVHDTGIGIAPLALPTIFEAFTQEDTSTTRRYGGSGLGTTISRQLVELMDGRIGVESIKGRGTMFWFELPLPSAEPPETAPEELRGARVLVLSGDAELQQWLGAIAARWGVQVVPAATEAEAIAAMTRCVRLGNPLWALLVDARAALDAGGAHQFGDLCEKAILAQTLRALLVDDTVPESQLREWGYCAQLARAPQPSRLYNLLHSSPQRLREVHDTAVRQLEPWASRGSTGNRRRVLVADDNRTNQMILTKLLEAADYRVEIASDGEEALERLLAGGFKAAILDLHMPGLDGVQVLRQYRLLRANSRLPIIMLTANTTIEATQESAAAGADAFLTKPVRPDELLNMLEQLVSDTEVRRLPQRPQPEPEADNEPVLDLTVLAELDRLYKDPASMQILIDTFAEEGRVALRKLREAADVSNHAEFVEAMHALKGSGANVGALRLVASCRAAEAAGVVAMRRDGAALRAAAEAAFHEALEALQALGHPDPTTKRPGIA